MKDVTISLLHPSRSRIDKSINTTNKWMAQKGDVEVELIVSVDEDDPQLRAYVDHYQTHQVLINQNRSAVDAINNAAKVSSGNILIVLSDDTDCPRNWGEHIREEMRDKQDRVLRVDDGIQDWIITMPVVSRQYYNRFGYIYHPQYSHMFCDTEFTHVANVLKKVSRCSLLFSHLHYSHLRQSPDELNLRANSTWDQGKQLYIERFRRNFDLDIDPWDIKSESHLRWLKHNIR